MHQPVHHVVPAHSFCKSYSVNNTLLEQSQVCQTQMILGIGGDTANVDSMVEFRMGEWTKGHLV